MTKIQLQNILYQEDKIIDRQKNMRDKKYGTKYPKDKIFDNKKKGKIFEDKKRQTNWLMKNMKCKISERQNNRLTKKMRNKISERQNNRSTKKMRDQIFDSYIKF